MPEIGEGINCVVEWVKYNTLRWFGYANWIKDEVGKSDEIKGVEISGISVRVRKPMSWLQIKGGIIILINSFNKL